MGYKEIEFEQKKTAVYKSNVHVSDVAVFVCAKLSPRTIARRPTHMIVPL